MFGVTERKPKSASIRRGPCKWFLIVTNATRSEVAARRRLTAGRVAGVTLTVCGDARGNRKRAGSTAHAIVASRASARRPRRPGHVLGVIEFDVEAFLEPRRKTFQWRIGVVNVRMADSTHRNIRCNKLREVTAGAGFVTGKRRRSGIVGARVTRSAGK